MFFPPSMAGCCQHDYEKWTVGRSTSFAGRSTSIAGRITSIIGRSTDWYDKTPDQFHNWTKALDRRQSGETLAVIPKMPTFVFFLNFWLTVKQWTHANETANNQIKFSHIKT